MKNSIIYFVNIFVKFFFLMAPFFALSAFLSMTAKDSEMQKKRLALKITFSVCIVCLILFLFGNYIFYFVGITIDSFRIGAGALLFLTAVSLVQGKQTDSKAGRNDDIVVVPLSIPIIAGPATIGTILVMSAEVSSLREKILLLAALFTATLSVGIILFLSSAVERVLKKKGITVMTKITGLILAALASQMVFTGIKSFLR
jgi:multiple antibiotic resistance protein